MTITDAISMTVVMTAVGTMIVTGGSTAHQISRIPEHVIPARRQHIPRGANAKTPCFMGHGTEDNVVLPECGEDAKTRFEAAGVPVNFSTYRMPHSTCGAEMRAVREFLREVLQLG